MVPHERHRLSLKLEMVQHFDGVPDRCVRSSSYCDVFEGHATALCCNLARLVTKQVGHFVVYHCRYFLSSFSLWTPKTVKVLGKDAYESPNK